MSVRVYAFYRQINNVNRLNYIISSRGELARLKTVDNHETMGRLLFVHMKFCRRTKTLRRPEFERMSLQRLNCLRRFLDNMHKVMLESPNEFDHLFQSNQEVFYSIIKPHQ